jgi:hypothetical protein
MELGQELAGHSHPALPTAQSGLVALFELDRGMRAMFAHLVHRTYQKDGSLRRRGDDPTTDRPSLPSLPLPSPTKLRERTELV